MTQLQRKYFGTDGIRGRVGSFIICPEFMMKLGWAIGTVLKETTYIKPHVLMGRDTRISGELLQSALQSGLLSAGVDVSLLGVLSTPAIAYFTQTLNASAGIVISASHNPYTDNGVKLIGQNGLKLPDEWELAVEQKMKLALQCVDNDCIGEMRHIPNPVSRYISHVTQLFSDTTLENYKIILDCANGATFNCAPTIFSHLHANIISLFSEPNGININDHCGATDVAHLRARVLAENADCGVAFDGDGDRLIMIDHHGNYVDGDEILCILATQDPLCNAVVGTLMSNLGLEKALRMHNIQFERVAVGDRYVLSKLQENNWRLGGEGSGHIVNLDYATTGDGIITALQILRIMQQTKKSLYELKNVMQKRPQILINVPVDNPNQYLQNADILSAVSDAEKSLGEEGRILLRASGTESCIRVMVECNDAKQAQDLAQSVALCVQEQQLLVK